MKLPQALYETTQKLLEIYEEEEAANMAAMLLEAVSGVHPSQQKLAKVELDSDAESKRLDGLKRLLAHEPIQYVIEQAWFWDMPLYVNSDVLIPRPETEELVHWIIQDLKLIKPGLFTRAPGTADDQLKILDVGSGSGCIPLALKKNLPGAEVWGCDKSDGALTVVRRNSAALDLRVDFHAVDFLDEAQRASLPRIDILVSNPPYVKKSESAGMRPNVLEHEPHLALFVPDEDALIFYRALAQFGQSHLHSGGSMYVEINEALGNEVKQLFENAGYGNVVIKKDMQGKDRMVRGVKNQ